MLPTGINRPQVRAAARPAGGSTLASGMAGIAAPVRAAIPAAAPSTPMRPVGGVNKGEIGQPWNFRFQR